MSRAFVRQTPARPNFGRSDMKFAGDSDEGKKTAFFLSFSLSFSLSVSGFNIVTTSSRKKGSFDVFSFQNLKQFGFHFKLKLESLCLLQSSFSRWRRLWSDASEREPHRVCFIWTLHVLYSDRKGAKSIKGKVTYDVYFSLCLPSHATYVCTLHTL